MTPRVMKGWDRTRASAPKFRNEITEVDGVKFRSKGEALRWSTLKFLEKIGEIKNLERQVKYDLVINQIRVGSYTPDFRYQNVKSGKTINEDFKGYLTATQKFRIKVWQACYPNETLILTNSKGETYEPNKR